MYIIISLYAYFKGKVLDFGFPVLFSRGVQRFESRLNRLSRLIHRQGKFLKVSV
jgi:hypothetical protein